MTTATQELVTGKHETCWKCGGAGRIDAFAHVAQGVCFACKGAGQLPAGKAIGDRRGKAVWTFCIDGLVWQFEGIHHGDNEFSGGHHFVADKGQRIDSVIFQVFKRGAHRRRGVTILRARVAPEIAQKVWRDAKAGRKPETMDNDYLGGFVNGYGEKIGPWSNNTCACTRNGKGVSPMM